MKLGAFFFKILLTIYITLYIMISEIITPLYAKVGFACRASGNRV